LVTDYLSGIDGRKMSKSWGNAIWLDDKPDDIFGKIMSLNDKQIIEYLAIATNTPEKKIETAKKRLKDGENPIKLKKELAYTIVKELYDQTEASKASQEFERIFQKGQIPTNLPSVKVEGAIPLLDLILASKKVSSKSEAKRLILQNAIEIDGKIKSDPTENITLTKDGAVCRIGKKTFIKFVS
jgi:tyrosyl-tRNA synthetase